MVLDIKDKLDILKKVVKEMEKRSPSPKKKKEKREERELPGFVHEQGAYFREERYPLNYRHGEIYLRECLEVPEHVLVYVGNDEFYQDMDMKKTAFIDTETTGLAGGTGTVAFLLGVGFFSHTHFVVRQYFMPDYPDEHALLNHFKSLMADFSCIVSFNGRTFDLPLIYTRMRMNRLIWEYEDYIHLDLLPGCRRFWRNSLDSCSLKSLEENILNFHRIDDIPGALIPSIYFQYLKNKEFENLEQVFEHNLYDILSMTTLITKTWEHIEMAEGEELQGSEFFSLGRIAESRNEIQTAIEYYKKAIKSDKYHPLGKKALERLANIYKQEKDYQSAIPLWEQMKDEFKWDVYPHIELAKYYEHHKKAPQTALDLVKEALERIRERRFLSSRGACSRDRELLEKRFNRLTVKLENKKKTGDKRKTGKTTPENEGL